jgi:spore coat assemly protein
MFKIGDVVTRNSYNNDVVFKIIDIQNEKVMLKGLNIRLIADSEKSDLVVFNEYDEKKNNIDDYGLFERVKSIVKLDRDEYFYLPGKILHVDGDNEYLERCMKFYKDSGIMAFGLNIEEEDMHSQIKNYLNEINPDILIITGHDAYYKKRGTINESNSYRNSENFVRAVQEARKYEKAHDKLIIIAGACQSNYEEIIRAGANFASSPKRINIHALDPAIIATTIGFSDRSNDIDLIGILEKTKYGKDGIGGIKTKGTMYIGYPR